MKLEDNLVHEFNEKSSEKIKSIIKKKKCEFCECGFLPKASFYKHEGGWQTSLFNEKVWIWLECEKCGEQWPLSRLGVERDRYLDI